MQARIAGILRGGSTVRPTPDGALQERVRDLVTEAYRRTKAAEDYQASLNNRGEWTEEDEAEYQREYGNLMDARNDEGRDEDDDETDRDDAA